MKQDNVLVRFGGGQDRFEDFVETNHKTFERNLVKHMMDQNQSLEWVTE